MALLPVAKGVIALDIGDRLLCETQGLGRVDGGCRRGLSIRQPVQNVDDVHRLPAPCPNQSRVDAEAPCHLRHHRLRRHSGGEDLRLLLRSPIPPPLLAGNHLNPAALGASEP